MIQFTHMPTSASPLSSLVYPQPWMSCSPAGDAVQQRSAHSFPSRHTNSVRYWGTAVQSDMTYTQSQPLPLAAVAKPRQLVLFLALACAIAWPSPTLPQTQLTCRLTVVAALPSLVHSQSQLSHSPIGAMAQQGSPSTRLAPSLWSCSHHPALAQTSGYYSLIGVSPQISPLNLSPNSILLHTS